MSSFVFQRRKFPAVACGVVLACFSALAFAQEELEQLPKLVDLEVPTVQQLLNDKPLDWIVLNTDDVLVVDTITPRPRTVQTLQQRIAEKEEQRRKAPAAEKDRFTKEIEELGFLFVTLPNEAGSPEFKLPLRRVKDIVHHEDLMLRRIDLLLQDRRIEPALELLTRLQRNWEDWPGAKAAAENILFTDARRRFDAGQTEAALAVLEELSRRNGQYGGLANLYGQVARSLIDKALETDDYLQAQFFINRVQQAQPQLPLIKEYDDKLSTLTRATLDQAAAAAQQDQRREAALLAERAAGIWPRTNDLRTRHRPFVERYQRLHVGVLGLPDETPAYPVLAAADERRDRLTRLRFFEIDRYRDGSAYYRTRFFDDWEPLDLGRRVKFTLRQFRQPYEMQASVGTPEVVAPLLRRLDPNSSEFDERLSAAIQSVNVVSPTEFTITFRRVPPRLEPLLASIELLTDVTQEDGLAPLAEPGGFQLIEQSERQAIYQRALPEPPGLPRYHVAEVVEHRYDSPEQALQALQRGEVSLLPEMPDWIIRRMQQDEEFLRRYFVQQYQLPTTHLLQFNPATPALRVRELRAALGYAIDRERLLKEVVLQDPQAAHGRLVTTPFLSASPGRNVQVEPKRFDVSSSLAMILAAKNLLKGEIPRLRMVVAPGSVPLAAAEEMARIWRKLGLDIEVIAADGAPPERWDILYRTLQMSEPLVEMWPFLTFQPQARLQSLNIYPDWLKQELVQLDRTSDQSRAILGLQQLHRKLWDDSAYISLWELDQFLVLRKNVTGFPQRPVHCYDRIDRWSVDAWYQSELP